MFEVAAEVKEPNLRQYSELKITHEKFLKLLNDEFTNVNVIGFNSSKFDLNLILRDFNTAKWHIKTIIG